MKISSTKMMLSSGGYAEPTLARVMEEAPTRAARPRVTAWPPLVGSFTEKALNVNADAIIQALVRAKPATAKGIYLRSITLSSTMGPGVRIDPLHFGGAKTEEG